MLEAVDVGTQFLWAFLDKTFGLGFATESGKGWLDGGSHTEGFLTFGVNAGDTLGFGKWWESRALVRRFPILK
jgi:thiosulfate dehydrogenase [quinone] large subunit